VLFGFALSDSGNNKLAALFIRDMHQTWMDELTNLQFQSKAKNIMMQVSEGHLQSIMHPARARLFSQYQAIYRLVKATKACDHTR
jgi:hypothetical protein